MFNCTVAAARSIQAGTDVDCGGVYPVQIENAVQQGILTEAEVDRAFARLTNQQMLLGLFDNNRVYTIGFPRPPRRAAVAPFSESCRRQ